MTLCVVCVAPNPFAKTLLLFSKFSSFFPFLGIRIQDFIFFVCGSCLFPNFLKVLWKSWSLWSYFRSVFRERGCLRWKLDGSERKKVGGWWGRVLKIHSKRLKLIFNMPTPCMFLFLSSKLFFIFYLLDYFFLCLSVENINSMKVYPKNLNKYNIFIRIAV